MLLRSNKKSLDTTKPLKLQRPAPLLSIGKIKTRFPDQLQMCGDRFKKA